MLKSTYKVKALEDPTEELKKKLLLKKPQLDTETPSTAEIDAEIEGNKPAYTKEQVDNSNTYQNGKDSLITGGNYAVDSEEAKINKNTINAGGEARKTSEKVADGAMAGLSGIMDMTASVMMNKDDMNKKERNANTMNMGMKGASTGAAIGTAVGGPFGTLIGAGAGLVAGVATGLIQGAGDEKRLVEKQRVERVAYIDDVKDKRRKAQLLSDGKASADKSQDLVKAQMGLLGSKYSQTKTT